MFLTPSITLGSNSRFEDRGHLDSVPDVQSLWNLKLSISITFLMDPDHLQTHLSLLTPTPGWRTGVILTGILMSNLYEIWNLSDGSWQSPDLSVTLNSRMEDRGHLDRVPDVQSPWNLKLRISMTFLTPDPFPLPWALKSSTITLPFPIYLDCDFIDTSLVSFHILRINKLNLETWQSKLMTGCDTTEQFASYLKLPKWNFV